MKLPGAERAVVEPGKVQDYLLSPGHPVGRFKAVFFGSLGYTAANWHLLAGEIRQIALGGDAVSRGRTEFGRRFEVRAIIEGPGGRQASVVTAWIVRSGEDFPRFVTAFPGELR